MSATIFVTMHEYTPTPEDLAKSREEFAAQIRAKCMEEEHAKNTVAAAQAALARLAQIALSRSPEGEIVMRWLASCECGEDAPRVSLDEIASLPLATRQDIAALLCGCGYDSAGLPEGAIHESIQAIGGDSALRLLYRHRGDAIAREALARIIDFVSKHEKSDSLNGMHARSLKALLAALVSTSERKDYFPIIRTDHMDDMGIVLDGLCGGSTRLHFETASELLRKASLM